MSYFLHPDAETDIANALDFYLAEAGVGVAGRFIAEFERIARLLEAHPGFGTPAKAGRRVFPLRIFPYSVVYRLIEADVHVLVVRHQHRRPNFGMKRK